MLLAVSAANGLEDAVRGVPSSYRSDMRTIGTLDVVADGIACIGMLLGGLFLLQRRAAGRTLTRIVSRILVAAILIIPIYTVIALGAAASQILIASFIGLLIRFAYPIIAARLLNPAPAELGLT